MAPIGKRIRDTERALKRCAPEKAESLREHLSKLQEEKKLSEKKLKEKANSQKYHLVKFVERQKICRKIHSIEKQLVDETSLKSREKSDLLAKRQQLVDDLTYVIYFPMSMKYIALFANENEPEKDETTTRLTARARSEAILARESDVLNGSDKVQHAIDVELKEANVQTDAKRSSQTLVRKRDDSIQTINESNDTVEPSKKKNKKSDKKKVNSSSSDKHPNADAEKPGIESDPFFVEEAADEELNSPARPYGESWAAGRSDVRLGRDKLVKRQSQSQRSFKKSEKELTKQELRLVKWQEKKRMGDGRGGTISLPDDQQLNDTSKRPSFRDSGDRQGRGGGQGRSFGGRGRGGRGSRSDDFRNPSSNSVDVNNLSYGGVSSEVTNAKTVMKNSGSIFSGKEAKSGKKTVFE